MRLRFLLLLMVFFFQAYLLSAQDVALLFKEADNLERVQKESDALEKYKQILVLEPANIKALVKASELAVSNGSRAPKSNDTRLFYESALAYAKRAFTADANNADANYAMAMACGRLTDVETENKKIVALVKDVKLYADKAVSVNPNHAKGNYTLGKWHYEMVTLSGFKKAAVKLFYGGLPDGDLDKAILYMEKCKSLAPYFVANQLDLAKAYKENHQPAKAIELLEKVVKLPTRTADDAALKTAAANLLASLQ